MTFRQAVRQTPDLSGSWHAGLQALLEVDRNRIQIDDPRRLRGSVNVEECLTRRYPGQRQWDYAVGFRPGNDDEDVIYWIEVHPANEGEVPVVLAKPRALKAWLKSDGQRLHAMRGAFI
jgi:hypothetical protein